MQGKTILKLLGGILSHYWGDVSSSGFGIPASKGNFLSYFQSAGLTNQHFEMLVFLKGTCQQI